MCVHIIIAIYKIFLCTPRTTFLILSHLFHYLQSAIRISHCIVMHDRNCSLFSLFIPLCLKMWAKRPPFMLLKSINTAPRKSTPKLSFTRRLQVWLQKPAGSHAQTMLKLQACHNARLLLPLPSQAIADSLRTMEDGQGVVKYDMDPITLDGWPPPLHLKSCARPESIH